MTAKARYDAARKRYESGEGYGATNWLAMNEARQIYETVNQHYQQETQAFLARLTPPIHMPSKSESFEKALNALATARDAISSHNPATAFEAAKKSSEQRHFAQLKFWFAAAIAPPLAIALIIETIAWILRGFVKAAPESESASLPRS